jgi:hypothetical protein
MRRQNLQVWTGAMAWHCLANASRCLLNLTVLLRSYWQISDVAGEAGKFGRVVAAVAIRKLLSQWTATPTWTYQ